MQQANFLGSEIRLMTATEAIRMRPWLYVGPLDDPMLFNRVIQGSLCIAADESVCGHCTEVRVAVEADDTVTVRDNGRGLPMKLHDDGLTVAEKLLRNLYACREQKESRLVAETCCDVALVVVNALSERLCITNGRDGERWVQHYKRGEPDGPFRRESTSTESGVELSFKPDSSLFRQMCFDAPELARWYAGLGLQFAAINIEAGDMAAGRPITILFEGINPRHTADA
jgi:DNA gyrase subunit B